jgi:hypothetical protein
LILGRQSLTSVGVTQAKQMVIWQETELLIQKYQLLCDLTIVFLSQRCQRVHRLDHHWPLSKYGVVTNHLEGKKLLHFPKVTVTNMKQL